MSKTIKAIIVVAILGFVYLGVYLFPLDTLFTGSGKKETKILSPVAYKVSDYDAKEGSCKLKDNFTIEINSCDSEKFKKAFDKLVAEIDKENPLDISEKDTIYNFKAIDFGTLGEYQVTISLFVNDYEVKEEITIHVTNEEGPRIYFGDSRHIVIIIIDHEEVHSDDKNVKKENINAILRSRITSITDSYGKSYDASEVEFRYSTNFYTWDDSPFPFPVVAYIKDDNGNIGETEIQVVIQKTN